MTRKSALAILGLLTTGLAGATAAVAHDPAGGQGWQMGPGMMDHGGGQGYGPGPGYAPGWNMGPSMMGHGYGMRPGMWGYGPACGDPDDCPRYQQQRADLSVNDVQNMMKARLDEAGNPNLKLGKVEQKDDDTITAEIVTKDGSLVDRYAVNRHTGWVRPVR